MEIQSSRRETTPDFPSPELGSEPFSLRLGFSFDNLGAVFSWLFHYLIAPPMRGVCVSAKGNRGGCWLVPLPSRCFFQGVRISHLAVIGCPAIFFTNQSKLIGRRERVFPSFPFHFELTIPSSMSPYLARRAPFSHGPVSLETMMLRVFCFASLSLHRNYAPSCRI